MKMATIENNGSDYLCFGLGLISSSATGWRKMEFFMVDGE
jgi:hypothetical protein